MPARAMQTAYGRVAHDLRAQLLSREFGDDAALPTEADISARYGVSRQTVRRAFQELVAEGLVTRVPGRGTFAAQRDGRYLRQLGSVEDLMALAGDSELRVIRPLTDTVDSAAAARLRLPEDHVTTVVLVRLSSGRPFSHTHVSLPPDVARRLGGPAQLTDPGRTSRVTVIGLLDDVLETPISEAEQSIAVAAVPPDAAAALGLSAGTAVLRIDRTYYDGRGNPVELAVSHFHPERYTYRVRLRRTAR